MAKLTETVLYYNPGRPETMKHVAMMKSVLVRMGIRIRNIGPEQVLETVGYLAGMDGFQVLDKAPEGQEAAGLPVIPVEMMVLKQFSNRRLDELEAKRGQQYPVVLQSWRRKRENLSAYFRYPANIRKVIYTTNAIESVHRKFRKLTKT